MSRRLGYLVPEFPGQTHVFFWREIEALRRNGIEVHVVSTRRPSSLVCKHAFAQRALKETHYLFPPHPSRLLSWAIQGCRWLREALSYISSMQDGHSVLRSCGLLVAAIDLVDWARQHGIEHVHGQSCADAAHVLALANALGGIPYSLTLHGDLDIYGGDHALKMKNAKFVSAVGQHLIRQIKERTDVSPDRAFSTLMGLDTSRLADIAEGRNYDRHGAFRIVTVARLNPTKGHLDALDAVAGATAAGLDVHYTLVGEGPHRQAIAARIRELGLHERTTLMGSLSEEEVFGQLAVADLFILPSFGSGEAWPVSVMEAMAAGLPVIATRIGATEEMIEHGRDGFLVAQRDSNEMQSLIEFLARDRRLREQVGRNAHSTAARRFDVEATSRMLLEAIAD